MGAVLRDIELEGAREAPLACDRLAFELGWDCACYGQAPQIEDARILTGYIAGRERFGSRGSRPSDRFIRKWLQLRTNAWRRGRVFDEAVTPAYLQRIDTEHCPILGIALTHATGELSDWSVDRINNDGAYAPGNLAVMSTRANKAKADLTLAQVLEKAERCDSSDGLTHMQWFRMGALMCGPCQDESRRFVLPYIRTRDVSISFEQLLQLGLMREQLDAAFHLVRPIRKDCLQGDLERRGFDTLVKKLRRRCLAAPLVGDFWFDAPLFGSFISWYGKLSRDSLARVRRIVLGRMRVTPLSGEHPEWCLTTQGYYADRLTAADPEAEPETEEAA
jgi:hypothetical protein